MKFNFTMEISLGLGKLSFFANSIEKSLNEYLQLSFFGQDVGQLVLSIICLEPRIEPFFKSRKAKFQKAKEMDEKGVIYCDLKLDYMKVLNAPDNELQEYLKSEILNTLPVISKIKIGDFDMVTFEETLRTSLEKI